MFAAVVQVTMCCRKRPWSVQDKTS